MTSPAAGAGLMELFPAPGEWTEADYYPLSEQGRLIELSDGTIEVIELPTDFHQLILLRLTIALHAVISAGRLGQVRFAPLPVRLWAGKIREPDLMFMSAEHADRIGTYWGVPDLAVEILSTGTAQKDRDIKSVEYARAGVAEYWIVDPEAKTVETMRLGDTTGAYGTPRVLAVGEDLTSPMFPGFSLALAALFAEV
jgi:Uma2 family endonuclease